MKISNFNLDIRLSIQKFESVMEGVTISLDELV